MKSIAYLTHVIIGFSGFPVILYLIYLGGRAFIHTCSVIASTYSFIVYGNYTSQLSYLNSEYKMYETIYKIIWFPDLPLEGINKIGTFLQYSFFSRDDAFNVFYLFFVCSRHFIYFMYDNRSVFCYKNWYRKHIRLLCLVFYWSRHFNFMFLSSLFIVISTPLFAFAL